MAIKEANSLFEIAHEYIEEITTAKDECLKWYEEVSKEAKRCLLSPLKNETKLELLPKTPVIRNKRQRRQQRKRTNDGDADEENAPPSQKSPHFDNCQRKLAVSLTRIDENINNKQVFENDKPKAPLKPPRFLRSSKPKSVNNLTPTQVIGNSEVTPPKSGVIYVSSASLTLSQEKNKFHMIPQVTCSPLKLRESIGSNRGTFVVTDNIPLMNASRRRSSLMRCKLRMSSRCSQRLLRKSKSIQIANNQPVADNILNIPHEDSNSIKIEDEDKMEIEPRSMPETASRASKSSVSSLGQQQIDYNIENNTACEDSDRPVESESKKRISDKQLRNSKAQSLDDNVSVISKTPSPVCPLNKVVRPNGKFGKVNTFGTTPSSSNKYHTPLSTQVSNNSRLGKVRSKYLCATDRKLDRNESIGSNTSIVRNNSLMRISPKYMTPQEKREKYREQMLHREKKAKEVLKKRDEILKKRIEENKRKREEKRLKVAQAKEQKQKEEEARLAKLLEEENKRPHIKVVLKKLSEQDKGGLAEKRKMKLELEKEKDKENASQKKQVIEIKKTKEPSQKYKESKNIEEQTKHTTAGVEKNEENVDLKAPSPVVMNTDSAKESSAKPNQKNALNSTVVLENCNDSRENNYEITPQRIYPLHNPQPDNYDISGLKEEDSTDDEEKPKKKVPYWAHGRPFKSAVFKQFHTDLHPEIVFPASELMLPPPLDSIFPSKKKKLMKRTSSAIWNSPVWKDGLKHTPTS